MANYKFDRSSSGDFGEKGAALIHIKEDKGLLRVEFRGGGKHTLKLGNCPDNVSEGRWMVQLNGDESEIFSLYPYGGSFQGKVLKFQSREGEPPQFFRSKGEYPDWMFTVVLVITSPEKYADMEVPYFLRNRFTEEEMEDGKSCIGIGKGKWGDNLLKFLRINKVEDKGPMPYKPNPLPMVEKRVLHSDVEFGFTISDGYVDNISQLNQSDSLEWDGDE